MNTIASMNPRAKSKVAFCCWGTFSSLLALGCGIFRSPLDLLGSTSAREDGALSDSNNLLRRDDFCRFSNGGAIAAGRFREYGSRGHAMIVLALLCFFGSGTIEVHNDLSQCP